VSVAVSDMPRLRSATSISRRFQRHALAGHGIRHGYPMYLHRPDTDRLSRRQQFQFVAGFDCCSPQGTSDNWTMAGDAEVRSIGRNIKPSSARERWHAARALNV